MNEPELQRFPDAQAVAEAAAHRFLLTSWEAVEQRGRFVVVLSGGSTPRLLHRLLASGPLRLRLPWSRTIVLFGDERTVPADHADSNYGMVFETLLDHVRIPREQVVRIEGELDDPAEAAASYERELRSIFAGQSGPRCDLLLLGAGEDGHTASLFPDTQALAETNRWVVANRVPQLGATRLTWTLPALCAARRVLFLITGAPKSRVVAEAFGGLAHQGVYPCERVVPSDGTRQIFVDAPAASLLPRSHR